MKELILRSWEVKQYSITKHSFSGEEFKPYMRKGIRSAFNSLSRALKEKLEGCKVDGFYSAEMYKVGEPYDTGEYTVFNNITYTSDIDNNLDCPPCNWTEACRFDCEDCCDAWCELIAPLIALNIQRFAVYSTSYQYTPQGIAKALMKDFVLVDKDEMKASINNIDTLIRITLNDIKQSVLSGEFECLEILRDCYPCEEDCDDCEINDGGHITFSVGKWDEGYNKGIS